MGGTAHRAEFALPSRADMNAITATMADSSATSRGAVLDGKSVRSPDGKLVRCPLRLSVRRRFACQCGFLLLFGRRNICIA